MTLVYLILKVLVADNGYMDDNVIKYAYENNIRLLIPDRIESSKSKPKTDDNPYAKAKFIMNGKQTHSFVQWANTYIIKTIEK